MNTKTANLAKLTTFFGILWMLFAITVSAQETELTQTRGIKSDDFVINRPKSVFASGPETAIVKSLNYGYKRKTKQPPRRNSTKAKAPGTKPKPKPKPKPTAKPVEVKVGVTMWRLRPPLPGENGPFLPVLVNKIDENWTPERVDDDTVFQEGDRVRFAIESSIKGYLYIVSSEIYSDGTTGDPFLIFPATLEENNLVNAGMLVDIPDQEESHPYFRIDTKRKDYAGESLLVFIVPNPLKTLKTDEKGMITSLDVLEGIEEYSNAEIFSRSDGVGSVLTADEKEATCGSKTRELLREKEVSDAPCGNKTRKLSREGPTPQTIYLTKSFTGKPVAFPVLMNVKAN